MEWKDDILNGRTRGGGLAVEEGDKIACAKSSCYRFEYVGIYTAPTQAARGGQEMVKCRQSLTQRIDAMRMDLQISTTYHCC